MSKPAHTLASLKAEVERLRQLNAWLSEKLEEAELRLGITAPMLSIEFDGKPVRFFMECAEPVVFADDAIQFIPNVPKEQRHGKAQFPVVVQRLRRIHLGAREAISVRRREIAQRLGMTERSLSRLLGVPVRSHFIGFVTPLGIESLRDRAPAFCAWVENDAFPAVIARFGKGGAS